MYELIQGTGLLVHIAALLQVLGLLNRDQLLLRGYVLAGSLGYVCFYYFHPADPLWGAIFWSVVLSLANLYGIIRIVLERTQFYLSDDEQQFRNILRSLTPGESRVLMQQAIWHVVEETRQLTREDTRPPSLYFILEGEIAVMKEGRHFTMDPGAFIGEIAFLLKSPASATVTLGPGSKYIEWPADRLRHAIDRHPSLGTAMTSLLNQELAGKLALSWRA